MARKATQVGFEKNPVAFLAEANEQLRHEAVDDFIKRNFGRQLRTATQSFGGILFRAEIAPKGILTQEFLDKFAVIDTFAELCFAMSKGLSSKKLPEYKSIADYVEASMRDAILEARHSPFSRTLNYIIVETAIGQFRGPGRMEIVERLLEVFLSSQKGKSTYQLDWENEGPEFCKQIQAEAEMFIDNNLNKTYTYGSESKPQEGGMEGGKSNINEPLSALAKSISTDTNVQAEFERQVRLFIPDFHLRYDEDNPPPVPKRKYQNRKDKIIPFLQEVWYEWNAVDLLSRPALSDHDPDALQALINWLKRPGNKLPSGLKVLTKSELADRQLKQNFVPMEEIQRIAGIAAMRKHRKD